MAHSGIRKNSVFPIIDRILNGIIPVVGSIVVDVVLWIVGKFASRRITGIVPRPFIVHCHVVIRVCQEFRKFSRWRQRNLSVITDRKLSLGCLLSRYQDNTGSSTGTIDGCRSCIFKYSNLLYVFACYIVEATDHHTIDKDKRTRIRHCCHTTHLNRSTRSRHTARTGNRQSRNQSLQRLWKLRRTLFLDKRTVDYTNRTCKIFLLYRSIADTTRLFKLYSILFKFYIYYTFTIPYHSLGHITKITEFYCMAWFSAIERILSRHIGGSTFCIVFIVDHHSDKRTIGIANDTLHYILCKSQIDLQETCQ